MSHSSDFPAAADVPKWFGLSSPISLDFPEEAELLQTQKIVDLLSSSEAFADDFELQKREKVLKKLESLYKEWLKEMCLEMNVPEIVIDNVGGKIFPFGSYQLGVHSKGADVDVLCVGPGFLERRDFFLSFVERLKVQEEIRDLRAVEETFVPVVKMSYDEIEIDLVFACVDRKSVSDKIDLRSDDVIKGLDKRCVRSLNGYRVTNEILALVPDVDAFRMALMVVKLWAQRRRIYSGMLGFLGGVSWAILVARVCQVYPHATASTLVAKFFQIFSMWEWPKAVRLKRVEDCGFGFPIWDPRVNAGDRFHIMPIVTPSYPQQNTACNVLRSTHAVMAEEIQHGHDLVQDVLSGNTDWSKLFEEPDFFETYQDFIRVQVSAATEQQHLSWSGLIKAKLRVLVRLLERNVLLSRVHVNPESMPVRITDHDKVGKSTMWLIGVVCSQECKHLNVGLSSALQPALQPFADIVSKHAETCRVYEEGMSMSLMYVRREQLHWLMPNGSRRSIYAPQRAEASAAHLPPPAATKRRSRSQMKHPAKRAKVEAADGKENSCDRALGESSAPDPDKPSSSSSSSSPTVPQEPQTPVLADEGCRSKVASRKRPATPELPDATGDLAKPNAAAKLRIPLKLRKRAVNTHNYST